MASNACTTYSPRDSPITMRRPLRVHLLGNTCNNHFTLATFLRRAGVDAHVFYNADLHQQTLPESEDPLVATHRPDWLHPYRFSDAGATPFDAPSPALARAISNCDLIQAEDVGLLWAAQSGRPYLWYPYGYDLNFYAFQRHWHASWSLTNPEHVLASVAYRQAIAGADEVMCGLWYQPLAHGFALLNALLPPDRFVHDIQLAIDADRFHPSAPGTDGATQLQSLLSAQGSTLHVEGLRLFHPSRVMFTADSYVNKANDRFFRALARFRAQGGRFTLVMVERGIPDEQIARELFRTLGIDDRITWIPAQPRHALVPWYQAVEMVPDEFIGGSLGSVSFEAMACGATLLTRLATEDSDPTYWPPTITFPELPPVCHASTELEIAQRLHEAASDPDALQARRAASRDWVLRWVDGPSVVERLIAAYERILAPDRRDAVLRGHGWGRGLPSRPAITDVTLSAIDAMTSAAAIAEISQLLDDALPDARVLWAMVATLARAGHAPLARGVAAHAARLTQVRGIAAPSVDGQSGGHVERSVTQSAPHDPAEMIAGVENALAAGRVADAVALVEKLAAYDSANDAWPTLLAELHSLQQAA